MASAAAAASAQAAPQQPAATPAPPPSAPAQPASVPYLDGRIELVIKGARNIRAADIGGAVVFLSAMLVAQLMYSNR